MVLRVEVWRAGQPLLEAEGEAQAGGKARVRVEPPVRHLIFNRLVAVRVS